MVSQASAIGKEAAGAFLVAFHPRQCAMPLPPAPGIGCWLHGRGTLHEASGRGQAKARGPAAETFGEGPPHPCGGPCGSQAVRSRALPPIFALYAMPTMQYELLAEAATSPAQRVPCLKQSRKQSQASAP